MDTILTRTMGATIKDAVHLCAVTNDLTSAVGTPGCQCMDRTFKTVEYMRFAIHPYFKTFIVFVSANLTSAEMAIASE